MSFQLNNPHRIAFLLGAGASAGAGHILPSRPPLGAGLYDALASRYPRTWGPESRIGQRYAAGPGADFEKTVSNEMCLCEPALNVLEWHRDVASFFADFELDGSNLDLYTRLLAFLRRAELLHSTLFTSINYDCLLEQAAANLRLNVSYEHAQCESDEVEILKIHGSCQFVTVDLSGWTPHLTNPGSFLECEMEILPTHGLRQALQTTFRPDCYRYPVLSLYAEGKPTQTAAGGIQSFRNIWLTGAQHATHLVIVGVRCNREDRHITDGITGTAAKNILYVGGRTDFEGWLSLNPACRHLGETFEGSFEAICEGIIRNS